MERRYLGDGWSFNTLDRATRTGQQTYSRALARKVDWPKPERHQRPVHEDPPVYTTLDEAFSAMMAGLAQSSKQCKRYHHSHPPREDQTQTAYHCDRFHTAGYTNMQRARMPQKKEHVHVMVSPGCYGISAARWGSDDHQTRLVNVSEGQAVELDFVV